MQGYIPGTTVDERRRAFALECALVLAEVFPRNDEGPIKIVAAAKRFESYLTGGE